jgi:uncharacterized membrane protein YheB (UPF0754 family)
MADLFAAGGITYLAGMSAAAIIGAANGKCVSSPVVSVGCESDTEISLNIDSITNILNTQIQQVVQSFSSETTALQEQNINIQGFLCKNTSITQSLNVKQAMTTNFTGNFMNNARNEIDKELTTRLDNYTKQVTELLGSQAASEMKASVSSTIQTTLDTYCSLTNINNVKNEVLASQKSTINIVNTNPNCENLVISQDLIINQITDIVSAQITANILSNEYLEKVVQDIVNKLDQEAKGVNSIIDSIMSFLKVWGIIIAVIVIAVIIGFVLFVKSGGAKGGIAIKTSKGGSFNLGPTGGKAGSSFYYF